jgi:hypothetical protein
MGAVPLGLVGNGIFKDTLRNRVAITYLFHGISIKLRRRT